MLNETTRARPSLGDDEWFWTMKRRWRRLQRQGQGPDNARARDFRITEDESASEKSGGGGGGIIFFLRLRLSLGSRREEGGGAHSNKEPTMTDWLLLRSALTL